MERYWHQVLGNVRGSNLRSSARHILGTDAPTEWAEGDFQGGTIALYSLVHHLLVTRWRGGKGCCTHAHCAPPSPPATRHYDCAAHSHHDESLLDVDGYKYSGRLAAANITIRVKASGAWRCRTVTQSRGDSPAHWPTRQLHEPSPYTPPVSPETTRVIYPLSG